MTEVVVVCLQIIMSHNSNSNNFSKIRLDIHIIIFVSIEQTDVS